MEFKQPTSQAEMDELRKSLRRKIDETELTDVVGGNDDVKGKGNGIEWTCLWCHKTFHLKKMQDAAKHCAHDCPANPFK